MIKRLTILMGIVLVSSPCWSAGQSTAVADRASLFFYLLDFTDFSANPTYSSNTNMCFLEDKQKSYAKQLISADNVRLQDRTIHIISLNDLDNVKAQRCALLFVDQQTEQRKDVFAQLQQHEANTLTVGETDNFVKQGGLVAIVARSGKMKLLVNMKKLQKSSLKISSQLLKMAIIYQ